MPYFPGLEYWNFYSERTEILGVGEPKSQPKPGNRKLKLIIHEQPIHIMLNFGHQVRYVDESLLLITGWMKWNNTGLNWDPREVKNALSVEVRGCTGSILDVTDTSQFSNFNGLYPPG